MSSYVSVAAEISGPRHGHTWRNKAGDVRSTVHLGPAGTDLTFGSADDIRALITACETTLAAHEAMEAEGSGG